jgi:hypothetical protein
VPIITQEDVAGAANFIGSAQHVSYLRAFFQALKDAGAGDAALRLGHEMNGGHYPWAQLSPSLFIKAFHVAAGVAHELLPNSVTIFNPLRGGDVSKWYPDNQDVGLVGVDWYNNGGVPGAPSGYISDKASWDAAFMAGSDDEPRGWGRWANFAHNHGKMLCVPEWGCGHGSSKGPGPDEDCPGFVPLLKDFFTKQALAGRFAFDCYFNNSSHQIDPAAQFVPRFANAYFTQWTH